MSYGICVGCDFEGSLKAVVAHIGRCPRYAERYQAGEDLLDPGAAYQRALAERKPAPVARAPRVAVPKVSEPSARVAPPKRSERRAAAGAADPRTAGPVTVECWEVPTPL
jgi:hypothetical protein